MDKGYGLSIKREILALNSDVIFTLYGFPISNSTMMILLITIIFLLFGVLVVKKYTIIPSNSQIAFEMIYEAIVDLTNQITNYSKKHTGILIDIIAGIIFYLTLSNILPLIPGITDIKIQSVSLFRQPTSDFSTTFGLALSIVVILQFVSIKEWGILGHITKYIPLDKMFQGFKKGIGAGVMTLIDVFVGLLDIIGEFAKVISLSLRLFGNMYAGSVLMTIIFGAIAWGLPAVWLGMNIFTGVLQAMVFAALTGAYYMLTVKHTEDER